VSFGLDGLTTDGIFTFSWDSSNHFTRAFSCTGNLGETLMTLPSVWQTGPQFNIAFFTFARGPNQNALVAWGGTTPGVDTSYILQMSAASFPTAPTFTNLTLPSGISTNVVTGVAYNSTTELWGAMVYDGTHSALWTTADLSTWTKHTDITDKCGGLQTLGPYWVTTAKRGGAPAATFYAPIYSFDGDMWSRGAGTGISSLPKLAGGRGCLATWSTNMAMVSETRIG